MTKKLFIKTHGCQMNEYDSDRMVDLLGESHGYTLTNDEADADVILLNTCSIREKAQERVFHQLGRWKHLKDKNPDLKIGVGGCVASQEGETIAKRAPHVDMIFGPQTLHRLPTMIDATDAAAKKPDGNHIAMVDITFPEIEKFDHLPAPKSDGVSAFVSIMEGCSKYCTFCVVPYTRGEEVSRPYDDVIAEVAHLASQGVREINFLGQNVNAYRGPRHDGGEADLAELITLAAQVEGIDRIRFTTSHPVEFSDSLVDVFNDVPELVSHLHLPVQSGSDAILSAMKRGHTAAEYIEKMERIRANRPDISFSSDFIIGFPGETEENFLETMDLIQKIGFDHSFSFVYSARPGTPASDLEDTTEESVKKQRLKILQDRITAQAIQIGRRMVGTTQTILVTGVSERDSTELYGRSENNRNTFFKCDDHSLIGKFVQVKITEAFTSSLKGELINPELAY
ncbi:tRNA (N6-isopentenyl adenosine(37)-C2)-methylthiotransferase MiaB [Reinekea marina]|uniref:tRNA-2-methylthio-N(6)-dimethylallyladenosine synthase n=1 Tax=Reinekea marina TaxID=1310421 RepID=A0ABV7WNG1_9GAMM|nr:tRNA (N6-isopentenyl adenosine(37)-C2)-methylthiotransferase MiaB [Reinekea marina]MBU2864736.1 tRNA (N6-isopentenyl adenosine(37)-C2)-methylthiotransferase MiaB [Reinekea forsetii]MDN3648710.1 tRNA (N6-isopentenyl adenosine(37)-C2)-methylthiotransferase MiaB [Reinekea marina]